MRLYEIDRLLEEVINNGMSVDYETGEVLFDSSSLDELRYELNEKMEACGIYLKGVRADIEALKAEESALRKRRQITERKAERLADYIQGVLTSRYEGKFETPKVKLSTRRSSRIEVEDESLVPADFVNETVTYSVDKKKAKAEMKNGNAIPGLALIESQSLQVS